MPTAIEKLQDQEDQLLARFWIYAGDPERAPECVRAIEAMSEGDFLSPGRGAMWKVLATRFAKGEPMHTEETVTSNELAAAAGFEVAREIWTLAERERWHPGLPLGRYAKPVVLASRAREQAKFMAHLSQEAGTRLEAGEESAAQLAWGREQATRLLLFHELGGRKAGADRAEVIKAAREGMERKGLRGVRWPYPRLQRLLGEPIVPGHIYGITGLWGSGKSTLLANLFGRLAGAGVPCIPAITEDADEWIRRAMAAEARVPQLVAENEMWDTSDREVVDLLAAEWECTTHEVVYALGRYRESYAGVVDRYEGLPWSLIDAPDLTPDGLIARFKALRRQWPGKHVVGMLDHAGNLAFPDGKGDLHINEAVRQLKQFVKSDDEGGFSLIVLFQARKPEKGDRLAGWRPIPAGEISGKVAQHLNVHFSLFRQMVMTDPERKTEWGTPGCEMSKGYPVRAKEQGKEAEGVHEDDEHVYIVADKRRLQGKRNTKGKTCVLNLHQPSGQVYELDLRHLPRDAAAA